MSAVRKVIGAYEDPADKTRRIYTLECGHRVSRRYRSAKRRIICGYCNQESPA